VHATHRLLVDLPAVCAFGDGDAGSLYVGTSQGHIYRVRATGHTGYLPCLTR
jgi:hypothetical protein